MIQSIHQGQPTAAIPPEILAKLMSLRPVLELQGIIQRMERRTGETSYRLRYREHDAERGFTIQRSVELGDANVAYQVQALLDRWRVGRDKREKTAAAVETLEHAQEWALRGVVRKMRARLDRAGLGTEVRETVSQALQEALHEGRYVLLNDVSWRRMTGKPGHARSN